MIMITLDHYVQNFPKYLNMLNAFDSNKVDNKLLKRYTKIWERDSSLMNIEFDSEPVYNDNDKYIKTKIKSYGDKVNRKGMSSKKQPWCNAENKQIYIKNYV